MIFNFHGHIVTLILNITLTLHLTISVTKPSCIQITTNEHVILLIFFLLLLFT